MKVGYPKAIVRAQLFAFIPISEPCSSLVETKMWPRQRDDGTGYESPRRSQTRRAVSFQVEVVSIVQLPSKEQRHKIRR